MTLLAEALAERKQALNDISQLSTRAEEASVKFEDDKDTDEAQRNLDSMNEAIERFERLSVQINKTNNVAEVAFEGRTMSIMEAVAHREALLFTAKHLRSLADHLSEEVRGRSRYGISTSRSKDDIKKVATVDAVEIRKKADEASQTVRRLDIAIQQVNWSTDLV